MFCFCVPLLQIITFFSKKCEFLKSVVFVDELLNINKENMILKINLDRGHLVKVISLSFQKLDFLFAFFESLI